MRDTIIRALRKYYHGEISKLSANVEIFLESHA